MANLIRNYWSYMVIFCGHFPDGAEKFTQEEFENETQAEWYLRQMLGSANFHAGPVMAFMSGNLCYQIEHHLFPDLPSNRYAEIGERVRALCEKYDLPYTTGSLGRQYMQSFWTIVKLALPNRFLKATSDDAPETNSELKFRIRDGMRESFGVDPDTGSAADCARRCVKSRPGQSPPRDLAAFVDATVSEYSLTVAVSGRDRLLGEALKLFASRGYAATSVADIQKAAGLAPGSGALYKHFASKRALLEAAVAHRIESIVAAREEYDAESPAGVEKAVRRAGQLIRDNLADSEDVLRVTLRESDELGDLNERTWKVITDNAYQRFTDELVASNRAGITNVPDPQATAAVAISSLTYAATLRALTGHTPGDVNDDRFFEAWVFQTVRALAQP